MNKKQWYILACALSLAILFLVFVVFILFQTCYIYLPLNKRYSETFTVEDWAFGKAPEKVTIRGVSIPLDKCEAYEVARQVWSYGSKEECDRHIVKIEPEPFDWEAYCKSEMPEMSYEECRRREEEIKQSQLKAYCKSGISGMSYEECIKEGQRQKERGPIYNDWDIYCDSGLHGMSPSVVSINEGERRVEISPGM